MRSRLGLTNRCIVSLDKSLPPSGRKHPDHYALLQRGKGIRHVGCFLFCSVRWCYAMLSSCNLYFVVFCWVTRRNSRCYHNKMSQVVSILAGQVGSLSVPNRHESERPDGHLGCSWEVGKLSCSVLFCSVRQNRQIPSPWAVKYDDAWIISVIWSRAHMCQISGGSSKVYPESWPAVAHETRSNWPWLWRGLIGQTQAPIFGELSVLL